MTKPQTFDFNLLIIKEEGTWVVQCLEWDIVAQGDDIPAAFARFQQTFMVQCEADIDAGREPLEGVSGAPKMYWDRYNQAIPLDYPHKRFLATAPEAHAPPAWMLSAMTTEARVA